MKMHLVMATVVAGLCSHAVLARSEGGDTGPNAPLSGSQRDGRFGAPARSEGGDTWSALQPGQAASAHALLRGGFQDFREFERLDCTRSYCVYDDSAYLVLQAAGKLPA